MKGHAFYRRISGLVRWSNSGHSGGQSVLPESDPVSVCFAGLARLAGGIVEFIAPGRQAGFHVDRIVMRARRINELLIEPSPETSAAAEHASLLASDIAAGFAVLCFSVIWSDDARASLTSDVGQIAARTVMKLNSDLMQLLGKSPVELSVVRAIAASLLNATENLRTRAYSFEYRRRTGRPLSDNPPPGPSGR